MSASNEDGECDLVANSQCSDGHIYEIDCGDDGTCTCSVDGIQQMSILQTETTGFCTGFSIAQLQTLSADCGWDLTTN